MPSKIEITKKFPEYYQEKQKYCAGFPNYFRISEFPKREGAKFGFLDRGVPWNSPQWTKWPEIWDAGGFCALSLSFGQVEVTQPW